MPNQRRLWSASMPIGGSGRAVPLHRRSIYGSFSASWRLDAPIRRALLRAAFCCIIPGARAPKQSHVLPTRTTDHFEALESLTVMKPSILPITTGLCLLLFACTDNIDLGNRGELGGLPNAGGSTTNSGGGTNTSWQATGASTARGGGTGSAAICGDGKVIAPESCDDGNLESGDGCSSACMIESGAECVEGKPCTQPPWQCGDGVVQFPESCDDGNNLSGDGCTKLCTLEIGWTCLDEGTTTCQSVCGDGIVTGQEQCDNGNVLGSGCSAACVAEPGWTCSLSCPPPLDDGTATCVSRCEKVAVCGNGLVEPGEYCDEGSANGTSGHCTLDCSAPSACGDGILQPGESCDDGNVMGGDGCAADCRSLEPGWQCAVAGEPCLSPVCGNGVLEVGEACDEGTLNGTPDHCTSTCGLANQCGDGIVQLPREQCDLGSQNGKSECTIDCLLVKGVCGNGIVEAPEQCDDGVNNGNYGSCGVNCLLGPHCGNGVVDASFEECDLGGQNGTLGCSTLCKKM